MEDKKLDKPKPIRKIPNKRIAPKPPKFNFMWLYAVAIAVFVGVAYFSGSNGGAQIDFRRFVNQNLKTGDVLIT
jgi:AFG3 family protein